MTNHQKVYAIEKQGRFLSHLFEDEIASMFQTKPSKDGRFTSGSLYTYSVLQIAKDIANQLGASVVPVTHKGRFSVTLDTQALPKTEQERLRILCGLEALS
jgi:hypothetical protein